MEREQILPTTREEVERAIASLDRDEINPIVAVQARLLLECRDILLAIAQEVAPGAFVPEEPPSGDPGFVASPSSFNTPENPPQ